jgi:hypothetical protein|nr:MAG TPA: hypothetical protein [Caudoviricetes sp.]
MDDYYRKLYAQELARLLRCSDTWNMRLADELVNLAGLNSEQVFVTDEEQHTKLVFRAAEKLGVKII